MPVGRGHGPGKNSKRRVRTIRKFGSFPYLEDDTVVASLGCLCTAVPPPPPRESLRFKGRIRGRNKSATFGYEKTNDGRRDNRSVSRLGMRPPLTISLSILFLPLCPLCSRTDTTFEKPSSGDRYRMRPLSDVGPVDGRGSEYAFDFGKIAVKLLDPSSTFRNLECSRFYLGLDSLHGFLYNRGNESGGRFSLNGRM